jgi:hypothetical protein
MATPPDFTAGSVLTAAQMNQLGLFRMSPTVSGSGTAITGGTITATGATSAALENCFSEDFDFYRMIIRYQTSSSQNLYLRLRESGTDATSNYNWSQTQAYLGFGVTVSRSTAQGAMEVGMNSGGAYWQMSSLDITGPALAEPTTFSNLNSRNDANYNNISNYIYNGTHTTADAYDGLNLFVFSGTFNAKFAIYGYRI